MIRKQNNKTFEFGNWHMDSELQTVSVKKWEKNLLHVNFLQT